MCYWLILSFRWMCTARRCRLLPISGFSDCSRAECDVGMGRPVATRNALERANLLLEGHFIYPCSAISPLVCPFALTLLKGVVIILLEAARVFFFFFFIYSVLASSSTFSYFLASAAGAFSFFLSLYDWGFFFHLFFILRLSFQPC